ncbi:MAG: endolytic transglycosylase MltG [Candidatus Pacebacteria bacterium]|nr:endolytic transglycosylase MltG [Candidatus Paceibacterota bacterium]
MNSLERFIERFFRWSQSEQDRLSKDWRPRANRRTILVIFFAGALAAAAYIFVIQPPVHFPTDQLVTVPEGASLDTISQTLYEDGVIRSPLVFRVLIMVLGRERGVHAGDYEFKQPEDIFYVAHALAVGEYGLVPIRIRIPEGATMKQMSSIFAAELPRFNADNFLAQTSIDEGYLFPDTYFFLPNATEAMVIQAMRQNFDLQVSSVKPILASSTHSFSDIVTMASIVEDEAPATQDRQMIAGILWRRIAQGYPLQADPTLVYSTGRSDSQLTIQDLQSDSPYNTYVRKGLPPTPIGSPSLDSIVAAAEATSSPYLYYLADHTGVTHYAKTWAQQLHNEHVYLGI